MRNCTPILAGLLLLALPACSLPTAEVQAGLALLSIDGDVGYVEGSSNASIDQDAESACGLGGTKGAPYIRGQLDLGMPVITVSAFSFEDEGQGVLDADFGSLSTGLAVNSTLEMQALKAAISFDIGLGPVSISPGIAVDYFDLSIEATNGLTTEQVDLNGPLPLGFLRATVDFGTLGAFVEAGYVAADVDEVEGEMLDVEAQLVYRPWSALELFAGYRLMHLELDGVIDNDTVDSDLTISGLIFGGGLKF